MSKKLPIETRKCKMCDNTFDVKINSPKTYCGNKCSGNDPETIARIQRNHIKIKIIDRNCIICNNVFQCKENSVKKYCSPKCSNSDPIVIEKMIVSQNKKYLEKYGCHPMQTETTKNNFYNSMEEKYGVKHALSSNVFLDKSHKTKLDRYGDARYINKEQIIKTKLDKYGSLNPYAYSHSKEYIWNIISKWDNVNFHFTINDLILPLSNYDKMYDFSCKKCGYEMKRNLRIQHEPICKLCNWKNITKNKSFGEESIYNIIKENIPDVNIITSDRSILKGYELDILLPDLKLAIEFNGIYWHSENRGKDSNYHLNKSKSCENLYITLLHIFDYQWVQNKNIVESMILHKIEKSNRIYARKCEIREVSTFDKKIFLEDNHLKGMCRSNINIGLYYNNELIGLTCFSKSRFDKNFQWEIVRIAFKNNISITGGVSKMISYFIKCYNPDSMITYIDKTNSNGKFLEYSNFSYIGDSKPNYFYFKDLNVYDRNEFQKHKLKDKFELYNPDKPEWSIMRANGYGRFWDCGYSKYVWYKKESD